MPLVTFMTTQDGPVAVRTEELFAAVDTAAAGIELWFDAQRAVHTTDSFAQVRAKLAGCVDAGAVSQAALVNPARVLAVVPNPDHAGRCFLQGLARSIPVTGDLATVLARLGG